MTKQGAIISESLVAWNENSVKLFVLNFYNSTSKVFQNWKQSHVLEFVNSTFISILEVLDRNSDFTSINCHIRKYCEEYLADKTYSQIHTSDSNCTEGDKTAIKVHSSDLVCWSGDDKSAVTVLPVLASNIEERSDESLCVTNLVGTTQDQSHVINAISGYTINVKIFDR